MQLPTLAATEAIGRNVFSSRAAKRARRRGVVIPEVFLERLEAESISVGRMGYVSNSVLAELARGRGQDRHPPRNFHGWVIIEVSDAASRGRTVQATPTATNPYHADIFLNLSADDKERRDKQIQHANDMAAHARWEDAPS